MKHVERFWGYKLTLEDQSDKRKSGGRKQSRKPNFESTFNRLDKKENKSRKSFTFQDPNAPKKISYELFFRSMVLCLVNWCQGNCRDKLFLADKEDYFVMKSRGCISFMNKQGKMDSKYFPLYIHSKANCLKKYPTKPSFSRKLLLEKT